MGKAVAPKVAKRFDKCILELGGNDTMILAPSADLDLATRGILFFSSWHLRTKMHLS